MASIKWDAYRSLNITSRNSSGATCVGTTSYGKRCRWDISDGNHDQICDILDDLEKRAPADAVKSLPLLAQLSLCEDYHQGQRRDKIEEWEAAIEEATSLYERGSGLEEKNRELKQMLKEMQLAKEDIQTKYNTEILLRKLDATTITTNQTQVKTLEKQLTTLRVEAKKDAQKMTDAHAKRIAEMGQRICELEVDLENQGTKMKAALQKASTTTDTMRSDLQDLKTRVVNLDSQVLDLTGELMEERSAKETLESKIGEVRGERDLAVWKGSEKITDLESKLLKAEAARSCALEEKERHQISLSAANQEMSAARHEMSQMGEMIKGLVAEVDESKTRLTSEQKKVEELHKSLQTASDSLSTTQAQLRVAREDVSHAHSEVEKLQKGAAKTRDDFEVERKTLLNLQAEDLVLRDKLTKELAYTKSHPLRLWFQNLFGFTASWRKPGFMRLRRWMTGRAIYSQADQENTP